MCAGMLRRWDDSQKYLSDNPHLVCEETANYLVIMCIDLEVEEVTCVSRSCLFLPVCVCVLCVSDVCVCLAETRSHGAGGSSDHRHAVYSGACQESEGGSTRLLSTILHQDQGVCLHECVFSGCNSYVCVCQCCFQLSGVISDCRSAISGCL